MGAAPAETQVQALGVRVHMTLHPRGLAPMGVALAEAQVQALGIRADMTLHLRGHMLIATELVPRSRHQGAQI